MKESRESGEGCSVGTPELQINEPEGGGEIDPFQEAVREVVRVQGFWEDLVRSRQGGSMYDRGNDGFEDEDPPPSTPSGGVPLFLAA